MVHNQDTDLKELLAKLNTGSRPVQPSAEGFGEFLRGFLGLGDSVLPGGCLERISCAGLVVALFCLIVTLGLLAALGR